MNDPVPYEQRCGALTRAGTPCRRIPAWGRVRCNLHGGKSPRGRAHPRFKHGLYSKFTVEGRRRIEEAERRRRVREARREGRYIAERYEYWMERTGGVVTGTRLLALLRRWRREYREREAERRRRKGLPPLGAVRRDPVLDWIFPRG